VSMQSFDATDPWENEMRSAARTLTDDLFHYTSADAGILGILGSGTLRLSPLDSTNDLWEARPRSGGLQSHADDLVDDLDYESLWSEIDRNIRLHAKVACLTRDWTLPDSHWESGGSAHRGWAHLSLWAHYGAGHTGICLRFSREKLLESFMQAQSESLLRLHGPVSYRQSTAGAGLPADLGQIKTFGVDAASIAYAEANEKHVFFEKHSDWQNEAEYRLIWLDQSVLPVSFDIRSALTGIFLGEAFSDRKDPALIAVAAAYPEVPIFKMHFRNRQFHHFIWQPAKAPLLAVDDVTQLSTSEMPLKERLTELRKANEEAERLRGAAVVRLAALLQYMAISMDSLAHDLASWGEPRAELHPSSSAVPDRFRRRAPGVPGERVHHQDGRMWVVTNARPSSRTTLTAAVAIQALDHDKLRLHGAVELETHRGSEATKTEIWRSSAEASYASAEETLRDLMANLSRQVTSSRTAFEAACNLP
jgi:hypothetical protein